MSRKTFDRYVRGSVTPVTLSGNTVRYSVEALKEWWKDETHRQSARRKAVR